MGWRIFGHSAARRIKCASQRGLCGYSESVDRVGGSKPRTCLRHGSQPRLPRSAPGDTGCIILTSVRPSEEKEDNQKSPPTTSLWHLSSGTILTGGTPSQ